MLFFVCSMTSEEGTTGYNVAVKFDNAALWTAPSVGDSVELRYLDGSDVYTVNGIVNRVLRSYGIHPAHKIVAYLNVMDAHKVDGGICRVEGTVGRVVEFDSLWKDY